MANEIRKPRIGDVVSAIGQAGSFCVVKVDDHTRTADIKVILTGNIFHDAPWMALSYATRTTGLPAPQR